MRNQGPYPNGRLWWDCETPKGRSTRCCFGALTGFLTSHRTPTPTTHGASNNPKKRARAPTFAEAKFTVNSPRENSNPRDLLVAIAGASRRKGSDVARAHSTAPDTFFRSTPQDVCVTSGHGDRRAGWRRAAQQGDEAHCRATPLDRGGDGGFRGARVHGTFACRVTDCRKAITESGECSG